MAALPIKRILALAFTLGLSLPLLRPAHAADDQWSREFFPAGASSSITAILPTPDGKLFYAGRYLASEDSTASAVVVMETGDIRQPLTSYGGDVYALAHDGLYLYAGGNFTNLSNFAVTNLARWDGRKWTQVGGGVHGGPIRAMAIKNGALYIGGGFSKAGNLPVTGLARWDGTNWTSLGAIAPISESFPAVRAIQFIGDSLFIAGRFQSVAGIAATNVAEYVQGSWRALGPGVGGLQVTAMTANSNGELFVGADFTSGADPLADYVVKWNGSQWTPLSGFSHESNPAVQALLCVGNDLYAVGGFRIIHGVEGPIGGYGIARWDGNRWNDMGAPFYQGATALAADAFNLYVGGPFRNPMYPNIFGTGSGIARYDGARWHISAGVQSTVVAAGIVDGKLRAVSSENNYNDRQNVADWDGSKWNLIGEINGKLTRQLLHKDGITYIIGQIYSVNGVSVNHIAAYDGAKWSAVGQGLSYPTAIDFLGSNLVAADSLGLHLWKDDSWQDLPMPFVGGITALTVDSNLLYVAGNRSLDKVSLVARWDGQQWTTLGVNGRDGIIHTIRVVDGRVYTGGVFTQAGDAAAKMLAVYDGGVWRELGGGINTTVSPWPASIIHSIEPDGEGGLFVGGYFYQLGNTPANSICHWNGEEWRPMGSGTYGEVYTLRREGRDLYAFGQFATVGNRSSSAIAKWRMADLELIPRGATNGTFNFEARGILNTRFVLQTSANLQQWDSLSIQTLTSKKLPLTVTNAPQSAHIFRLIAN